MKPRTKLPPARAAALAALRATLPSEFGEGEDSQAALDRILTEQAPGQRDKALATELVYGYLRLKGRIEAVLSLFLKTPESLPADLHLILGLAGYEILFLDRVPSYASVSWAVDEVRASISPKLAGLANAVLRRVGELGPEVGELPFFGKGDRQSLERFYSCPEWIIRLWEDWYGTGQVESFLQAQASPPALGVIVESEHLERDQAVAKLKTHPDLLESSGFAFAFPPGTRLPQGLPLRRGSFAARQALLALKPETWPEPVWDACCGRGGKTRVLLELGKKVGASDVHRGRIRALKAEQPKVRATVASALERVPSEIFPSRAPQTIFLDAPCSGLGVLSRRPDTKWRRSEADLAEILELQARLLDAAASNLASGGCIAYITCTLNPDENEEQVRAFLDRTPAATLTTEWTTPSDSPLNEFFYAALITK